MKTMDYTVIIDELLKKKAYLADIFPKKVPHKEDGRYFRVEKFFQRRRSELERKFTNILLKLYCWFDFVIAVQEAIIEYPGTEQIIKALEGCFGCDTYCLNIILPDNNALLTLNSDDLYMCVYNAEGELKELISQLVRAEGLFFYEAPEC